MFDLNYLETPEFKLIWKLTSLVYACQGDSATYTHLGPSGHDNHLGYTEFDLVKYKRLLAARVKTFLIENKKEIKQLKMEKRVMRMIAEARSFSGKTIYKMDPNARPGRNHHTGEPYY